MQSYQTVFQRREIKYLLNTEQYATLMGQLETYMKPDRFAEARVNSLYYDTEDYRLIRASLDKPVYKEKLRLRTYGVTTPREHGVCGTKEKISRYCI